jgi:hypothetical protein
MGAFFTNYQVRSDSAEKVIGVAARSVKTRAYVSPPKDGWVTVYDETSDDQDQEELQRLAKVLSRDLSTAVFAFLDHDSDILMYFLYERGEVVDEYNSNPDYFDEADEVTRTRCRGSARAVLKHCVSGTPIEIVKRILHHSDDYGFAEDILADLAPLLGMDEARLHLGFKYFTEEGAESLPDAENFQLVGKGVTEDERTDRKEKIREATAAAGPRAAKGTSASDLYCMAIGMITMARGSSVLPPGVTAIPGINRQEVLAQVRKKMDATIKRMVKQCASPEWPSGEALVAAADKGPSELAGLIATGVPQLLDEAAMAAAGSDIDWLRAFVEAGANVNAANQHGSTALMRAIGQRKIENLAYLLQAGADANAKFPDGKTPLQFALQMNRMDAAELLRQHGAKE